jgi:GxxExxY protein
MYEELTYTINGCLFTVYNTLGNIWPEQVYEQALDMELQAHGVKTERQKEFEVFYFGKRVGHYRLDLLVEDKIILELKAVPEVFPVHQAQLISYLKGYDKPLGILANFGGREVVHRTFPNKMSQSTPLHDAFDFDSVQLKGKDRIRDLLFMANRILVTLGVGYFHQVYRRAFYHELQAAGVEFEVIKEIAAIYRKTRLHKKSVNFFRIGDLLLSAIAVQERTPLLLLKFRHYLKHLNCARGLIFNFHTTRLDFKYIERE